MPQSFAGVFVLLAALPDWMSPLPLPVPLSVCLGAVLPDLLARR